MALQAIHKSVEEIPEVHRELYSERNGQFELTGIAGVKTQADVDRLNVALSKERDDHKSTKSKAQIWGELDYQDTITKLDRIPELEAAAQEGGIDEVKMNELVEGRMKTRLAPIERENLQLKTAVEESSGIILSFKKKETKRLIRDDVRAACLEAKIIDTAHEDALFLAESMFEVREDDGEIVTKGGVGVTPGIRAQDWLNEMQSKRPHWWAPSHGGGAAGSNGSSNHLGDNPWTAENWNMTKQGFYVKQHGMDKASIAAKSAGSFVGSITAPVKK